MAEIKCRHFNGYKPCGLNTTCDRNCFARDIIQTRVVLIHLGAMGAVVRSTALLAAIKRKFTNVHITWVTQAPSDQLLRGHSQIDRVLTTSTNDLLTLSSLKFDVALCIDKSLAAAGVLARTYAEQVFGFVVDAESGAILPATSAAEELWEIGLSNQKKFFENLKPETQLIAEALELSSADARFTRDDYNLELTIAEKTEALSRRKRWLADKKVLVGINTGCSDVIKYKKLPVEDQRTIAKKLLEKGYSVALLGGPEDTSRNQQIGYGLDVIQSATESGLRDGFVSVAACDVVITGDSLGMHLAIAAKKYTVVWFGPTCAHEIDLYDRGAKILANVTCSPCWKRSCHNSTMCYDRVNLDEIISEVDRGVHWLTSSSRPPFWEMPSSQFL